ncbi:MAG: hypothetical protein IPF57_14550 [Gammaproteobacteria bacterium]|nr:hypothetical protein [Gammaproteobacteria bacterium]
MTSLTNPVLAAASQSQSMSYDLIGRLTSRTEPEGTASWTYDTGSGLTVGRLVSESVGGFSRSYTYDAGAYGKPTAITTTIDGQSYTLSQSYDAAGRLETLTYPASQALPERTHRRLLLQCPWLPRAGDRPRQRALLPGGRAGRARAVAAGLAG